MGGGQSQEAPTATRNSSDQQIGTRDVSSRKSDGVPSLQPIDLSRGRCMMVDDGRREEGGERRGRECDEPPSIRHHSLTQPSSHSHNPPHSHPHNSHGGHNQRPHPHRQRHHIQRPLPELPTENFNNPFDMELNSGVPIFGSSRTQLTEPSGESQHPSLGLVLPSRQRHYYEASNPADLDLDLSMASLSRRLRVVGLLAEGNGSSVGGVSSGNGGSASSSSRRHHRPRRHHTHSSHSGRSRHHLSTTNPPSSVVLVRGLAGRMTCPLCSKEFSPSDLEEHLLTCMTKPRVRYNVDTLQQDSGECSICLEDMLAGEQIARLPCLCIYHIRCIKKWYKVNPTCPEHPDFTA